MNSARSTDPHHGDPWTTERVKAYNARHLLHPMVDPKIARAQPPLIIARGDGVYVYDIDGKRYLDTVAGLWNVNIGHNRSEVKRAITEQLERIAYYSSFINTSNPPAIELSARLAELFEWEGMVATLFGSGGSDATETAIKLARQYWKLEGQGDRIKIISLKYGFHGVHMGGTAANGNPLFRQAFEPVMPGFVQVEAPYFYRNPWTRDPEELGRICADVLDREMQYQGARTVAAFLVEPVQGAGGVIVPPPNYWPLVRKVCDKHGVLLIADEVVTGFGRTGAMSGSRGWGVKPDIMCLAKGINSGYVPLGATMISDRVAAAWSRQDPLAVIMHGYTNSGHPLACAAANAALQIVVDEDLPGNAASVGAYMIERLQTFAGRFGVVGEVRGKGLMMALELVKDNATKEPLMATEPAVQRMLAACRRDGMIVRIQGNKMILSPPLIFQRAHVDEMISILEPALAALDKDICATPR
jgi:adenosylmethionine-8-amino-7-oxononanoate aminotransferase